MIWARVSLRVFVLLMVLCGTALLLGQRVTLSGVPSVQLQMCDDKPCTQGITPGVTPWTDLLAMLQDYEDEDSRVSDNTAWMVIQGHGILEMYRSVDGESVGRTFITGPNALPFTVGWLLVWFGEPCGVTNYPRTGNFVIRYPFALVNLHIDADLIFTPYSRIRNVQFVDPAFESKMQPDICVDNITDGAINTDWHGFGLVHYR